MSHRNLLDLHVREVSRRPLEAAGMSGRILGSLTGWRREVTASVTTETGCAVLRHQPPVAQLSATPAQWDRSPMPLGSHRPEW
jgi:hypothetical protein